MKTTARKPGPERRTEIAEAALGILEEQGITGLTTAELARRVGLTTGALFRHYASIEEILDQAVRGAVETMEGTFPEPGLPPLERLLGLARNRVKVLGSNPALIWLLRSEQATLALPPAAVERLADLVRRSRAYVLEALREGAAQSHMGDQGSVRDDVAPEVLAVVVMGTIHGLVGLPGVHKAAGAGRRPSAEQVLDGLVRLLAPPGEGKR